MIVNKRAANTGCPPSAIAWRAPRRRWTTLRPITSKRLRTSARNRPRNRGNSNFSEHGHLHLFWHATRSGRRCHLGPPEVPRQEDWKRSAPSHLIAIGLDARGLPVSSFSVNHWVTDGHRFDADTTLGMIRRFELKGITGHADSCDWLTAFVRLYEPVIARVLRSRDRRLAAQPCPTAALKDRRIEVVSMARLDCLADLNRIDLELKCRGLAPVP